MNWLKKCFIKDYKNTSDPAIRVKYGIVAGVFGIISNIILFIAKIVIGFIGNSITIIADAVNNLSDAGSSVITILGFKLSSKPADNEHPYGHARFEYIAGFMVALLIFAIGIILGKTSIEKIISPEITTINIFTYIILGLSIVVKLWQLLIYRNFAKAISSEALKATSQDSRNDIITTSCVLLSTIIINITNNTTVSIDGIFGLAVSLFIVVSSIKLLKDTIDPLLGTKPDHELVNKLKEKILTYDGVLGLHDLMVHNYGANNCFVLVHVEVSASDDILKSHELIDTIERDIMNEMNIHICIHMDPIQNNNEEVIKNKEIVTEIIKKLNDKLSIHDFRMVIGKGHTNILFDVAIPFSETTTKEDILSALNEVYSLKNKKYYFIISIDRTYSYDDNIVDTTEDK